MDEVSEKEITKDTGELIAKIEAVLFVHGEPITIERLSGLLEAEPSEIKKALKEYQEKCRTEMRGVALVEDGQRAQLVTNPLASKAVADLVRSELSEELTPAALETLSIIAYLGPTPRQRIDYLRGVNSTFTLRNLLVRGLIERIADPGKSGAPLYRLAFDTMNHLGISRLEDLPNYAEIQKSLNASTGADAPAEQ